MNLRDLLLTASAIAIANEAAYARLDAAAGDGDFGGILARAARQVRATLDDLEPSAGDREILLAASHAVGGVGGTTGPIWGAGLLRAADAVERGPAAAVRAAADGIAELGGAGPGDRTLLDALVPAAEALETGGDVAAAARQGAERTSKLSARRGRASYVPGRGAGSIDAGAQAVADIVRGIVEGHATTLASPATRPSGDRVAAWKMSPGHVVADPLQLVDDAIALDTPDEQVDPEAPEGVGRRGVAGTIVVEKMCGAAADAGADLAALAALGRRVAAGIRTIGVSVSGVTLPGGGDAAITLEAGEQEFGVGIHGEPGRERGTQEPADQLVARMCQALLEDPELDRTAPVLLYTNGLGGLAGLELSAAHGYAVRHLQDAGLTVARSMAASLVTSLGMVGFSLTVARLDDELTRYWDAPCSSAAWTVR